ncbi:MAG TPA: hypothetical protein VGY77_12215 [Gemmataceae bacterium]|jgi:hypothetical protein|nr:hypothetical protein [Gemmataceae bacterium]
MFAIFCLRLATGMMGALLLFSPRLVNPRFYRTHFLTVLCLTASAVWMVREFPGPAWWISFTVMALAFLGALSWSLEKCPGGKVLIGLTLGSLLLTLAIAGYARLHNEAAEKPTGPAFSWAYFAADELTSVALLGTSVTAMLMGHSYLLAPSMSLTPLLRLLAGLFIALFLRFGLAAAGLWFITRYSLLHSETDTALWLPLRWGVGFVAPLILCWMAWESAKIQSTQSATGILYVVVVFCFLGELTAHLLFNHTGYFL